MAESSDPDRFAGVTLPDGESRDVRVVEGHLFVCEGCCCGNRDKGVPKVPLAAFKEQWKARGIRRRLHLSISSCLGPCAVANVVLVSIFGRTLWLHSIHTEAQVSAIYDYVERMLARRAFVPPEGALAQLTFQRYASEDPSEEHPI